MRLLSLVLALVFPLIPRLEAGEVLDWNELPSIPDELGVAGPFVGVHADTLYVAGGANFPLSVWENDKVWYDAIYALPLGEAEPKSSTVGKPPRPLGYGVTVSIPEGIVCIGGNDANQTYADVFFLVESDQSRDIKLPALPTPLCYASATVMGSHIYVAGGTSGLGLETAQKNFWRLDWSQRKSEGWAWESLDAWPGPERAFSVLVTQSNGESDCLYLIGGRHLDAEGNTKFLKDVYEYDPRRQDPWRKRADLPMPQAAGTAAPIGQSHIFTLGGADGSLFEQADDLKDDHPGFPKTIFAYHTITDTWIEAGEMPQNQVTTQAVSWGDQVLLASGEVRPRVRSPKVWSIEAHRDVKTFAAANWVAIVLYLAVVVGIGVFFSRRNKNTNDFFRGGQRVPAWVAGLSIFATMLSSITFISLPAKSFATDWIFILMNAGIILCAPLIAYYIIPYFRKMNATSAYEYLEQRFNLAIRLFASTSFVLFQIGRMAIVMYLPALALAAITPLPLSVSILIMGVMSIIYCTMGGLEAVVWTDALQAIVLLGGAFLSFGLIIASLDGGWGEFTSVAAADQKMRWANFDFSDASYMTTAFWVMLVGGLGSSLIPYSSDQVVVQRYVSTPTEEKARKAVWMNAGMSAVATVLFFSLGTALYVFYKATPTSLDPTFRVDSVLPLFISRELPVGVAGIVVAAVFAAAQSTVSSSMNSTSTVIVTDFFQRLGFETTEAGWLRLARVCTVVLGTLGTVFGLVLVQGDIKSAWETFLTIIGFVLGPICGIFMLGMFTKAGNAPGAVVGAVCGVLALIWAREGTPMHGLLYAPLGIVSSFVTGLLGSLILGKKAGA